MVVKHSYFVQVCLDPENLSLWGVEETRNESLIKKSRFHHKENADSSRKKKQHVAFIK
jgi:hypothetical protein